jgi:hypothetical protein
VSVALPPARLFSQNAFLNFLRPKFGIPGHHLFQGGTGL